MTKTKEEIKAYKKKHYDDNKERYAFLQKKWRAKNMKYYKKIMKSWEGFIPLETKCQICGKIIYFNRQNTRTAIHFDHRRGGESIQGSPANFIRNRMRNPEREAIWTKCDFGMLCEKCNRSLPTENRLAFLKAALKYCIEC